MRLINIDTCVSCKIGYQSVFFQFVMGGCHWNVQHWPRFGVLWQMFSMNANRVWIHERSKDLKLGLVDYELRDIFLEGINHYDKCGFSWIEFCEAKLPCLVNSGSLDKCRIDWWSLITQRCGNSKISDDIPIICEPAILGDQSRKNLVHLYNSQFSRGISWIGSAINLLAKSCRPQFWQKHWQCGSQSAFHTFMLVTKSILSWSL